MKRILWVFALLPALAYGQMSKSDSLWLPLVPLIGQWSGTGEAPEGKGKYERTYQFVLNKKFIELRNKSVYAPSKESPKGYTHEDYGLISYDKARKTFVLRQFHTEGFMNQYVLERISPDGKTIVFVTESIENIPAGWRARETYVITGNTLTEAFDLAEPGKEFAPYTSAQFTKVR